MKVPPVRVVEGRVIALLGSPDDEAVVWAGRLAASGPGPLTLLSGASVPAAPSGVGHGPTVERVHAPQDPAGLALDQAEKGEAALLVASTLSHDAARLFRRATCPLLFVPPRSKPDASGPVLVPVDFRRGSEEAARFAFGLGSPVELIHVYTVGLGWHKLGWTYEEFSSRLEARCRADLDAFASSLPSVPAGFWVERGGEVAPTLHQAARFRRCSAMVIHSRRRSGAAALFPGTGERAALGSPVPVWVLRDARPATFLDLLG